MKKIATLLFSIILSFHLFAADTVLLDFETSTVPGSVSSWLNYAGSGLSASTWSIANPHPDEVNSTANCYKVTKKAGDVYWIGLEVNLATPIKISAVNQYLHVFIYKNTGSRIALTYTPSGGSQSADAWQSNSTTGSWIDYVLTIPAGIDLKTFAIKIADDPGDYYFDQIILSDNPASLSRTTVSINPAITNQAIDGWGGSICWWGNIMGGYSDTKIKTLCDWITDPVNGLNMNIFRFNIGGGDDPSHNHMRSDGGAMPGYKASLDSPYDWNQDANQRKILKQLIASRIALTGLNDIQIIGFSNSPPYWMTRSGCSAGSVEGNLCNLRSDMYTAFADYLTEVVKHYHDSEGITFNYIEPFNEPDGGWWKANGNQEGCYFANDDQIKMIRELYTKLSDKGLLSYCQITANDANNLDNGLNSFSAYKTSGDILEKIPLISVHTYGGNRRSELANFAKNNNKKLWQSESGPIGVGGTTEHNIMVMSDRIITDLRDLKCTAWNDWQIGGYSLVDAWGLISGSLTDPLAPLSKGIGFYIRSQYSRYVKAGYTIIDNNAGNVLTAISPDQNELVIVISNQQTYTQKYKLDLSKFSNFGKSKQIRTRVQESLGIKNASTLINIIDNSLSYDALPESVATYIIPINQGSSAINEISKDSGSMYYSEGVLYTNFSTNKSVNIAIFNTLGQKIKTFNQVSAQGVQPLDLKNGLYIVTAKTDNKIVKRKIDVY
ncbi:glycoside hydrolase [uncultured Bacteroides sp.]|uniref:glycoside hydrolase n=1 Tax=uncultured Bacteroides sp. TaxID=162156 RepID=UPI002AAB3E34|nr:glycoside hydrolase [uncultured Bacteroides sp.]